MKRIIVVSASCLLLAGCNDAPKINLPPAIITSAGQHGGMLSMSFPPGLLNFYSPCSIAGGGKFQLWSTNGDRISLYESTDGKTWTGGEIVLSAIAGSWEDDGNFFMGYHGGLSDPRVVKGATPGWVYTMYYTGGHAPNTETSGGIGCAVSNDGRTWQRKGLLRHYPGGNCFIQQALTIRGKRYLYFLGGGDATHGPRMMVADDVGDGIHFVNDRPLPGLENIPGTAYPLFYDEAADSCWMAFNNGASAAGPTSFDIYKGSDGFTSPGTKVCTIDQSITGNIANFNPQVLQRTDQGMRSGSGKLQIVFSTGNGWANWQPASVLI